MPANGRWDLTRRLKAEISAFAKHLPKTFPYLSVRLCELRTEAKEKAI